MKTELKVKGVRVELPNEIVVEIPELEISLDGDGKEFGTFLEWIIPTILEMKK